MPPSHNGIAPVLRTGPLRLPGSIPGGGVHNMKNKYNKYDGKIVRIHRRNQKENCADLVGRVNGNEPFFLTLGYNTYFYNGDNNGVVVSRIKIAEMGYKIHNNLVLSENTFSKSEIERITILRE